jgi:hypothetical protein
MGESPVAYRVDMRRRTDEDRTERADGVVYPDLLSQHLPEVEFRGKEHRRIQYAVLTPFAVRGGLEPDRLDEVTDVAWL